MRPNALEQLFVARRSDRVELRMVLVDPADGRTRVTHLAPTADEREAVRWLGRHLAREGEIRNLARLRVRVERGGELSDAPALARDLVDAYRAERAPLPAGEGTGPR